MKLNINNETVYFEPTDKYKTISVGMIFFHPFKKEFLAEKTLLTSMMTKVNQEYKTEKEFNIHCQELYDMYISMRSSRIGQMGIVYVNSSFINPIYTFDDIDLIKEACEHINSIINKPYFTEELLNQEKRLLINDLKNVYNNKQQYANRQFINEMFKDEMISIKLTGEIEDIEKVDLISINECYKELLSLPRIYFVIGDVDEDIVKRIVNYIKLPKSNLEIDASKFLDLENKEITSVKKIEEVQDINQSILCMGYRSDIRINSEYYTPMTVFNGMLGLFFHSSLFQVIREEHSLAYSIGSDYNPRKGNMAIVCGIKNEKSDEVIELVNQIISDYQNGNIDEEILELTKKAFINQLKRQSDSPSSLITNIYTELSNNQVLTLEEKIDLINKVTMEDITNVSNMIKLDTIYILRGSHDEKNN